MKLTPWFPSSVNPKRKGVYKVVRTVWDEYPSESWLRWNGKGWQHTKHSGAGLLSAGHYACMFGSDKWCGLARKPK
jgi:hypothetical protein